MLINSHKDKMENWPGTSIIAGPEFTVTLTRGERTVGLQPFMVLASRCLARLP